MATLTRSALMLVGFTGSALVLGAVRQGMIAHFFGSSTAYNAFVIAEAVPLLLVNMFFGGALIGAVVPAVVERLAEEGEAEAWRYAVAIGSLFVGAAAVLSFGIVLLAPLVVDGLGVGLPPETRAAAIGLTRVVVAAMPIFAAATIVAAVLNAHDEFFAPGLRNLGSNLPMVIVLSIVGAGLGADGLVIGFASGAALQLLIQIPRLWRLAHPWIAWPHWQRRDFEDLGRRYAPILVSHLLFQSFTLLDRSFSTLADPAGAAHFFYAERIVNASRTIIGGSLGVVIFPRLTRLEAAAEETGELIGRALGVVTLVTIPFTLALVLYGESFVALFFEHGSFTASDNRAVTSALVGLAPAAIFIGAILLLDRIFIVRGRIWTFAGFLAVGLGVDLLLKLLLVERFGVFGVAMATTTGTLVAATAAFLHLRAVVGPSFTGTVLQDLGRISLAFGVGFALAHFCPDVPLPPPFAGVASAGLALGVGIGLLHLLAPPVYVMFWARLRGD